MCQAIVLRLTLYLFISYINPLRWAVLLFPFTVEETEAQIGPGLHS